MDFPGRFVARHHYVSSSYVVVVLLHANVAQRALEKHFTQHHSAHTQHTLSTHSARDVILAVGGECLLLFKNRGLSARCFRRC